jgi:hypothetical protein
MYRKKDEILCWYIFIKSGTTKTQVDHDSKIAVVCWCNPEMAMIILVRSQGHSFRATISHELREATLDLKGASADHSAILARTPPPKNVEQNILGYVDCLKFFSLFLLIAQFNNNKTRPHNTTSTTHNKNQNEPSLPNPWRLCPLIPWACQ